MPVRRVLLYPQDEATLRQKSTPIEAIDDDVRDLITDLKETLATQPGAGLAAPQIGVHRRVVLVCLGQDSEEGMQPPRALINPQILEEGPYERGFDGCLSLPNVLTWDTLRPTWLRFSAWDEQGQRFEMRVEGIDAILVHHEIDHLEGVLFWDRLPEDGRLFWYNEAAESEEERLVPLAGLPTEPLNPQE